MDDDLPGVAGDYAAMNENPQITQIFRNYPAIRGAMHCPQGYGWCESRRAVQCTSIVTIFL